MANIEIDCINTSNSFTIKANDYTNAVGSPCITLSRSCIGSVYLSRDSDYVVVEINNRKDFIVDPIGYLAGSQNKSVKIDRIGAVTDLDTVQKIHDAFLILKG